MNLPIKQLLGGLLSYTPFLDWKSRYQKHGTGGTESARYCYSVWLRHLVILFENGMMKIPKTIAELGPGDSIGIGIAALLSGCDHYNAFDVIEYSSRDTNLQILNDLIDLFLKREDIPDDSEFPLVKPALKSYAFPSHILSNTLNDSLSTSRINAIKSAILNYGKHGPISIAYCAPWFNVDNISEQSIDLIYSQAVLEHVDDLAATYQSMHSWLSPKGFMSHQIDFTCHTTANYWNGHWTYNDMLWTLIRGRRPYLLNREPYSTHVDLQTRIGFKLLDSIKVYGDILKPGLQRTRLPKRFAGMSDEDFSTSSALIVSTKQ
jgi:hypothetical protein